MRKLVIWGSGGHAREINWLCEELDVQVMGFLDERPEFKVGLSMAFPFWELWLILSY